MRFFLWMLAMAWVSLSWAQTDSTRPLHWRVGIEAYYSANLASGAKMAKPSFVYAYNQSNQLAVNLAFAQAKWQQRRWRANLGVMAGTYASANLATEPKALQYLLEANIGYQLHHQKNWWLDAGVMPSHIGWESAIGPDNWALTRSIMADNSPYYETGVKLSYTTTNNKWLLAALVLNGWQRMEPVKGNRIPAFGHQLTYMPTSKWVLNSSSFIGSVDPDSARRVRLFHNAYAQWQHNNWSLLAAFDVGVQQAMPNSSTWQPWWTCQLAARYQWLRHSWLGRIEYYKDPHQVIIIPELADDARLFSVGAQYQYQLPFAFLLRLEYKHIQAATPYFGKPNDTRKNADWLTAALSWQWAR